MKDGGNGHWRRFGFAILSVIALFVFLEGCSRSFLAREPRRLSLLYTGSRSGEVEPRG